MESKKTIKQTKHKQARLIDTKNRLLIAIVEGGWKGGKIAEGDLEVQTSTYKISHEDVIYGMGNVVSNMLFL